ncbi:BNR-4 repeat-containing protein [Saliphagus infecundisoli]|uniref:BNR-4 repeat-containing protein n=1 Tax=Saliphagus infecundisoli TaxID=1849069 RepID=A0ABD5Q9X4_9EURY|nr:BNR-4 repeat-containing protein [Saliphagus infecundisoli]
MTGEPDRSRGLLGHWEEVSPGGIVRDRSPEGNDGNYGIDARWIWFTNPRATFHAGEREATYLAYLGGPTGRDVVVGAYDHDRESLESTVVERDFSPDDHTNPSLALRADGRLLVFWGGHNGESIRYTVSCEPESVAGFGPPRRLEGESVTYPNPIRSPDGDSLLLFYRDRIYTRDATDDEYGYMGDGNCYLRRSDDEGATWGDPTLLAVPPEGHYSLYALPARGPGAIHLFFTDAERGGDAPKWNVMYAKLCDGRLYAADDTLLGDPEEAPLEKEDLETVYDSHAPGNHHAWLWDCAVDSEGRPVVAYATFPSTLAHEYRYARWTGEEWADHPIADAGPYIARRPIELHYSGGLSIDRSNPSVVYGCVARGRNRSEGSVLTRFETDTGGRTWSSTTVGRDRPGWDLRPVVPRNASEELPVLWLAGSYDHMDTSQTVLRGLPTDRHGGPLAGDGRRGVDLGLAPYGPRTFADGLTVAASIRLEDLDSPGTVANLGSATLEVGDGRIEFGLEGPDGKRAVPWDVASEGERYHVAGTWNGDRLALAVDGEYVAETAFGGPIGGGERESWTLLKGEYLFDRGFEGRVSDVRLYRRALSAGEIRALAG